MCIAISIIIGISFAALIAALIWTMFWDQNDGGFPGS